MNLVIPMRADHFERVFPLVLDCYRESGAPGSAKIEPFIEQWGAAFRAGIGYGFVAIDTEGAGTVCGFNIGTCGRCPFTGDMLAQEIVLYVPKDRRGSGIGSELFRRFQEESVRRGAARLLSGYVAGYEEGIIVPMLNRRGFRAQEQWWVKEL